MKLTEETKEKMRKAHKGKKCPWTSEYNKKHRVGENNPNYGKKGKDSFNYGFKHTEETKIKMSKAHTGMKLSDEHVKNISLGKIAEKNPMWKGDDVEYHALHEWIRNRFPKPELCMVCAKVPPYDLANVSGKYLRDLNDWLYLCRKCHMDADGRLINLLKCRIKT